MARASSRDWALHRPSTPEERTETARLNREFGAPGGASVGAPLHAALNPSSFDRDRQMREDYDRRLREYYRAYPPGYGADIARQQQHRYDQVYARPLPPPGQPAYYPPAQYGPPARYASPPPGYASDAARLDPWHGYNSHDGLSNGY